MFRLARPAVKMVTRGSTSSTTARLFATHNPFRPLENDEAVSWQFDRTSDHYKSGPFTMQLIKQGQSTKARVFHGEMMKTYELSEKKSWRLEYKEQFMAASACAPNGC